MKSKGRYKTSGSLEDSYEPDSDGQVLKNKLGIKDKNTIDEHEAAEQLRALNECLELFSQDHRFSAADICKVHELWLGSIYEWAGSYRQVNISKGGFPFAMALHVPTLMVEFEKNQLRQYTPCLFTDLEEIIHAISVVHTELVLIHPFREGNGRLARMIAVLMGLQAGLPPLDFSSIKGSFKQQYFSAVQAGMDLNYKPMEEIFRVVLQETIRQQ